MAEITIGFVHMFIHELVHVRVWVTTRRLLPVEPSGPTFAIERICDGNMGSGACAPRVRAAGASTRRRISSNPSDHDGLDAPRLAAGRISCVTATERERWRAIATRALAETADGRALLREQLQREEQGLPALVIDVEE